MADHALATVSNPSAALTDFTLIVDLADMPASWWTAVDTTDGTRGRVYKGDGTTRLACDWIDFDDTAETGLLRVLWSGSLASSGTQQLWIEPPVSGNAAVAADNTYGSDNAYDANWEGYWPFDADFADRTVNGSNASTGSGNPAIVAGGKRGQCLDATPGGHLDATISTLTNSQITIIGWGKPSANSTSFVGTDASTEVVLGVSSGKLRFVLNSFTTNDRVSGSTSLNTTGVWQHLVGRYDGSTIDVFLNGTEDGTATPTGSWGSIGAINIGSFNGSTSDDWEEQLDDVQIHSTGRSDPWIVQEYDQTNDNSTFWGTWSWTTSGVALEGTVTCTSTATGAITTGRALAGTVSAESTVAGALTVGKALAGSVVAESTASGTLTAGVSLAGSVTCVSTVAGTITTGRALSGSVAAESTVSGAITTGKLLAGSVAATSTAEGALTVAKLLEGLVACESAASGELTVGSSLNGRVVCESLTEGALTVGRALAGSVQAQSTVTGQLSADINLAGAVACVSTVTGRLGDPGQVIDIFRARSYIQTTLSERSSITWQIKFTSISRSRLSLKSALTDNR